MAHGTLKPTTRKPEEQFAAVNDERLQLTIAAIADKYDEAIRAFIYKTYQDNELAAIYRAIRASGIYQKGSKSKVHRKILEFPNVQVADFCDTVMTNLYGEDWLADRRALRHELIKPWHVVEKL